MTRRDQTLKRAMDLTFSVAGLIVLWPVILLTAILARWDTGASGIFRQERIGRHGRRFRLLKVRTMRPVVGTTITTCLDDRITPLGAKLRRLKLDELPQAWNILCNQMSLVGPRPLLMEYLPLYTPEQARRHEVRPGITGWAQINGRNAVGWDQKFSLDVWYVDRHTLWLDVKILALTLRRIVQRDGISAPGSATMEKFQG